MEKITLSQLEQYLSKAAWILKGPVDASDFKVYIFPLLFFKRISDVYDEEYRLALEESDGDKDYAALPEMHRFEIPQDCHWQDIRETTTNVGAAIESALRGIEQANQEYLYGIFGDAQWSNKNKLSDALLIDLVEHFSQYVLGNQNVDPDMLRTFDCVIANPPFSLKGWGAENWANDPYDRNIAGVPPKGNGDMAWVQHMVKSMNSTGRMTVVLPHGALFRKAAEGQIRKQLLEQDMLEAVIGLGPNVFYGTQLAACVMVFKQNKPADKKGKVLFIDASDQIRAGRAQNFLEPNHVQQIYDWYHNYQDVENYVKVASNADLEENDYNLNIPLYVEKIIEDNLPSVEEAMADLKQAWQASLVAEEKFKQVLKGFL
ncbi:N-6 DNA methylase [Pseudoalteromonas sp. SWXJZ94C]|uniref:type I restriction-modification system subunit M n=1 Tax=Pseudoalteromonas sp. SWXJZ94C TaxID=2792065 RepID=UPI0018CFE8CB|nr:type I restriction-modification system subunit M [Pseudoalteromonas sp. SWXJZ94C]MBH0058089.1 N-6 DNA methylase [Pseudoalteromonas sp. SWXJZ94C]